MSLWAIIPVKPLNRAKSRLSEVLTPDQRYRFAETMFKHVLSVVLASPQVAGTLVISRDTKALAIAREMGARSVQEGSPSDLNPALIRATEVVRVWGASGVLILPADLPFIATADVAAMARLGIETPSIVLATDAQADGTNAMLVRPPGLIDYQYGMGSYHMHLEEARRLGVPVLHYESERLQLDIDVPEDLARYNRWVEQDVTNLLPAFLPDTAAS